MKMGHGPQMEDRGATVPTLGGQGGDMCHMGRPQRGHGPHREAREAAHATWRGWGGDIGHIGIG